MLTSKYQHSVALPLAVVEAITGAVAVSTVFRVIDDGESESVLLAAVGTAETNVDVVDDKVAIGPIVDDELSAVGFTVKNCTHIN